MHRLAGWKPLDSQDNRNAPQDSVSAGKRAMGYLPAGMTIGLGLVVSALVCAIVWNQEQRSIQAAFRQAAENRLSTLKRGLETNLREFKALGSFFAGSREVERDEFRAFVRPLLAHGVAIQALEWIPRVPHSRREEYEQAAREDGLLDFQITNREAQGRMVRAAPRQEYFPVYFVEPYEGNETAVGYDLGSNPARLDALNRSCDTGQMVATARITLVQETAGEYGFVVFLPIYCEGAPTDSVEDRREKLRGFALGVFRIGEMVEKALTYLDRQGIDIRLYDESAPAGQRLLYFHSSREPTAPAEPITEEEGAWRTGLHYTAAIDLPGRTWSILCTPAADYVAARRTWHPWAALAAGLLSSALLGLYLTTSVARTASVMATNRRLAHEVAERKRAEEGLRESDERIALLLNSTAEAIYGVDLQGNCTFCNAACLHLLGYKEEGDLLGKDMHDLIHHTRPDGTPYPMESCRIYEGFRHGQGTHVDDEVLWKVDGASFPAEYRSHPIHCNGQIVGAVVTFLDITERKRAAEEDRATHEKTRRMNAELTQRTEALQAARRASLNLIEDLERSRAAAEAANRAKSEFLANMSHEIRTPMTAILGFAENLLDVDQTKSQREKCVHTIQRNGNNLLAIINNILDLSKIEACKMTVECRDCQPCRIIAEVSSLMRVRAGAKGVSLNIEYVGAIPDTIQSDPTRLRQILINLIGNAIKFTEVGDVRLITRFVDDADNPCLQFDVIDTGRGMTEEQKAKLFQPFMQADNSTTRQFGGTGLGLTISKRFAEMLGGDITVVATERGAGSTFRAAVATGPLDGVKMLDDPMLATFVADADADNAVAVARALRSDIQGCRILLAEDSPDIQRLIAFFLKKAGADVTVVDNGKFALDAALAARDEGNPFDVILMDIQMPVMDGYEAVGQLRRKGYTGSIIALTANAMAGDRQKCINAGCDDYATKPIDRKKLIATIEAHLHTATA